MGMIRGKIESDREVLPKTISFGVSPFKMVGKSLVNTDDPLNTFVEVKKMGQVFKELGLIQENESISAVVAEEETA